MSAPDSLPEGFTEFEMMSFGTMMLTEGKVGWLCNIDQTGFRSSSWNYIAKQKKVPEAWQLDFTEFIVRTSSKSCSLNYLFLGGNLTRWRIHKTFIDRKCTFSILFCIFNLYKIYKLFFWINKVAVFYTFVVVWICADQPGVRVWDKITNHNKMILFYILALFGFSLNVLTIVAFWKIKEIQTPGNFLILNLALSDCGICINAFIAAFSSFLR